MNQMNDSGILMISHDAFALESLCEMILVMERGRIIEGGPMEKLPANHLKARMDKEISAANIKLDRRKWEWMEY